MALVALERALTVHLVAVAALQHAVLMAGMRIVLGVVPLETGGGCDHVVPIVASRPQAEVAVGLDVFGNQVPVASVAKSSDTKDMTSVTCWAGIMNLFLFDARGAFAS